MLIHAALDHHVDLDRMQARTLCGGDAVQHGADRHIAVAHAPESLIAQPVQADADTRQPCILERQGFLRQHHAVRGQCHFQRFTFPGVQLGEHFHQTLDAAPQQRFTAGQADLLHAQRDEQFRQSRYFLETEQFAARQELMMLIEDFARHAIRAAQIAAVGHRNAQVAQRALQGIEDRHGMAARQVQGIVVAQFFGTSKFDRNDTKYVRHDDEER